jgi:hypothetical protein
VRYLLGIVLSLAFAAPATAQDAAVGEPSVITDPATETEPTPTESTFEDDGSSDVTAVDDGTPAPEPEADASGRRGEIHVLDATSSSSPAPASPAASARAPAGTLPFTGPHAAVLALVGLALLATGARLRSALRPA